MGLVCRLVGGWSVVCLGLVCRLGAGLSLFGAGLSLGAGLSKKNKKTESESLMWLCCWSKHTKTVVGNNTIVMEAIWWQFAFIYCWELWKDKWKDESKRIMGIQNDVQIRLKVMVPLLRLVSCASLFTSRF